MSELSAGSCEPCRVGAPLITDQELRELSPQIPDWQVLSRDGVKQLTRHFTFDNFTGAMAFANAVGALAEEQGHHPALLVEWGQVTVSWWTHKIGGLHKNDVLMAAKTDTLYPQ